MHSLSIEAKSNQVTVIAKYTKYTLAGEIDLSGNRNLNGPLGILTIKPSLSSFKPYIIEINALIKLLSVLKFERGQFLYLDDCERSFYV